jgi:hypothetical protein
MIPEMLDYNEAQTRVAEYAQASVDYSMVISDKGDPFFLLHDYEFTIEDGWVSVDTTTKTTVIEAHAFIEITIGKRAFSLQMCLLAASSIWAIKFLLGKTVDPKDGRFGSKETQFVVPITVIDANRLTAYANVDLRPLSLQYVTLKCFPKSALERLESEHCPFCRRNKKRAVTTHE